jgi:prepilin-type N-terminal cleavage/methylation domain-containing protein
MRNLSKQINIATQKGFTLIELVIVIVIVGILAAVAIPNFSSTTTDAQTAANQAILGSVKSAWAVAYASNKGVPPSKAQVIAAQLDPVCDTPTVGKCGTAAIVITETAGAVSTPKSIVCSNC